MGTSFEEAYERHVDAVFRFALRLAGRRDIAEDLTSEAFLELFRNRDRIEFDRLPGWLFTVVRNRAMDYWRRRQIEDRHAAAQEEPVEGPHEMQSTLFDHKALRPVHRVCLVLRYVHGMTRAEIARHTGLSEIQIKGHLQYARHLLRGELTKASR